MYAKPIVRYCIFLILKMLALVALLFIVVRLPGQSVLNYYGYSVELSTGLLAGGILICFLFFHQFLGWMKWVRNLPTNFKKQLLLRRDNKNNDLVIEALNNIAAGDSGQALQLLEKARALNKNDPYNAIFTAQAAYNQDDDLQTERQFTALLENEATKFLGYRGLVLLRSRQGNMDEAHNFLQKALGERPDSPWALNKLFIRNVENLQFASAETILEQLRTGGYLSKSEANRKKAVLFWVKAENSLNKTDFDGFYEGVNKALKFAPELTVATVTLVKYYAESDRHSKAWKCLKQGYTINPHPDFFASLKQLFKERNSLEIYQQGLELVAEQRQNPVSHWLLGKLAVEAKLWGQARTHAAALHQIQPNKPYFELMIEIESKENPMNIELIQNLYLKSISAPRSPTWICEHCHAVPKKWHDCCPSCHSFDQIVWGDEEEVKQKTMKATTFLLSKD